MRHGSKRWLGILAGLVALAATPALAQDEAPADKPRHEGRHAGGERRGHDPEKRLDHLREALDLTDAQITEIRSIFAEQAEKRQELKASGDREAMRAHMRQTHERMASVLTEEQREKLGTLREHRGEKHGQHDGDHPRHRRDGAEG